MILLWVDQQECEKYVQIVSKVAPEFSIFQKSRDKAKLHKNKKAPRKRGFFTHIQPD